MTRLQNIAIQMSHTNIPFSVRFVMVLILPYLQHLFCLLFQPVGMTIKELKETVDTFGQILNKFLDVLFGKEVRH